MCAKKLRLVLPVISHCSLPVANEIVAVSQTRVISKLHVCTLQVESTVIDRFRTDYSFESLI